MGDPLVVVEDDARRVEAWIHARDIEPSRIHTAELVVRVRFTGRLESLGFTQQWRLSGTR